MTLLAMQLRFLPTALVAVLALLGFSLTSWAADNLESLAKSVSDRSGAVEAAVAAGTAKETSQGLLEASPQADQAVKDLVAAENRDRRAVFLELGKKFSESPAKIAERFTVMARLRSQPSPSPPATSPPLQTNPAGPATHPSATAPGNPTSPVKKEGTSIPLKVLTRPFSSIVADPQEGAAVLQSNVPAFTVYYVYAEQPGWFQIGKTKSGGAFGWIREKDAIRWKQNLVMEFTHPASRIPVMFFREKEDLKRIALESSSARVSAAEALLDQIRTRNMPSPFPVEAVEPNRATDARAAFYMLPITEFEAMEIEGRETKLLKVAAATKDRKNTDLTTSVQPASTSSAAGEALLDVVFVMDCSSSMRPMVDATIAAVRDLVSKLASDPGTDSAMNLGFWGYRDSAPDQDFGGAPVKNFTPVLQTAREFLRTLESVEVSSNPAGDYAEDVFGGVKAAITQTRWRPNSLRMVILVGDAAGHPAKHPKNSAGMGESELRALADDQRISISSFYIERDSSLASSDRQVAEPQFRKLGQNRNSAATGADFAVIPEGRVAGDLDQRMALLASQLSTTLTDARKGSYQPAAPVAVTPSMSPAEAGAQMAKNMFSGAFVDWLGRQKDTAIAPPGDVESWVVDRDLKDPAIRPMAVKVLLQKGELDALAKVLDNIVTAGVRGQVTGQGFFEALQSAAASAVSSPDQIRNARNLAATGLLPDFLADLPYRSRLMMMDAATWNSMSADSQNEMLESVQAKRKFYEETLRDSSLWQSFNPEDSEDEKVASVPLEQLP